MIQMIKTEKLHPHPNNPRHDLGDLAELAASIKVQGVLQNLTVVPYQVNKVVDGKARLDMEYTIVIGHRRHAAAQLAGLTDLPCTVADMTEQQQIETMLLENIQRADLTIIEQAAGFQMLMDLGESVLAVAEKTGFSESTVRNRLKIAVLDKEKAAAAYARGATLMDFIELDKVRDKKKKAQLLADMGTNNWNWSVRRAINAQDYPERRKVVEAFLKGWAEPVKQRDWNRDNQLIHFGDYLMPEDYERPADAEKVQYVYVDSGSGITVCKRAPKGKKVQRKKTQQEIAYEERVEQMKELCARAYDLRYTFVKEFGACKKYADPIMSLAVFGLAGCGYGRAEREKVLEMLEIKQPVFKNGATYDERAREFNRLIFEFFDVYPERVLFITAYCRMEDTPTEGYFRTESWNCKIIYKENDELNRTYGTLVNMGYEMSDEEKQLQDGTHPLFDRPEQKAVEEEPAENEQEEAAEV